LYYHILISIGICWLLLPDLAFCLYKNVRRISRFMFRPDFCSGFFFVKSPYIFPLLRADEKHKYFYFDADDPAGGLFSDIISFLLL